MNVTTFSKALTICSQELEKQVEQKQVRLQKHKEVHLISR